MLHRLVVLLALAASTAAGLSVYAEAAGRPTALSINACTDQLLLALADSDQVLGVTRYARDPERSAFRELALRVPLVSGTAEEVLAARPDIVLAGRFTRRTTRDFLRARGFRVVEIDAARSLDDARAQIRAVGALLGHPQRAEAGISAIDAAVAEARAAAGSRAGTVLALQRRGWVSGPGTLLTSLLREVGLENVASRLGRGLGRQLALEEIVTLRADYVLLTGDGTAADQGSAMLHHPALAALYPPERRIVLSESVIFCGGPALATAIRALATSVTRLPPPR